VATSTIAQFSLNLRNIYTDKILAILKFLIKIVRYHKIGVAENSAVNISALILFFLLKIFIKKIYLLLKLICFENETRVNNFEPKQYEDF